MSRYNTQNLIMRGMLLLFLSTILFFQTYAIDDENSVVNQLARKYIELTETVKGYKMSSELTPEAKLKLAKSKISNGEIENELFNHLLLLRLRGTDFANHDDLLVVLLNYFSANSTIGNKALSSSKPDFTAVHLQNAISTIIDKHLSEDIKKERASLNEQGLTRTSYNDYYEASFKKELDIIKKDNDTYNQLLKLVTSYKK